MPYNLKKKKHIIISLSFGFFMTIGIVALKLTRLAHPLEDHCQTISHAQG
jgi:hypothetical protein